MKNFISAFGLIFLLLGCASTTQYAQHSDSNKNGNNYNNETMAQIYVLRPSSFGSAITFKIYEGEKFIGELGPKSYLSWQVDPAIGEIKVISKSENYSMLLVTPEVGKTYFIKQKVKMGWIMARTDLEWLTEKEALDMLKKLKAPKTPNFIQ
ncbi:hypothetical protein RXV94_12565 [Yeosuana sp. MJ-SS3]|uniref:DUF2846 domain-containing protein n=1 Tax=Gilvirhabdus luticola TaxID=3079858 RepID=A0ABU3U9J5_9FLAO|nr:hypothetical protein [Yeosuana sp. MJ-SS3]MDU8886994.1 hypothetical protein [Yeosuana sp. MJ-SS3]